MAAQSLIGVFIRQNMRNFKITLEYDGSGFCGWQTQAQGERTVQGELEAVFLKIFKQPVHAIASGRTDSGVHAHGRGGVF